MSSWVFGSFQSRPITLSTSPAFTFGRYLFSFSLVKRSLKIFLASAVPYLGGPNLKHASHSSWVCLQSGEVVGVDMVDAVNVVVQ